MFGEVLGGGGPGEVFGRRGARGGFWEEGGQGRFMGGGGPGEVLGRRGARGGSWEEGGQGRFLHGNVLYLVANFCTLKFLHFMNGTYLTLALAGGPSHETDKPVGGLLLQVHKG